MKTDEFKKILDKRLELIEFILDKKAKEYSTNEDRLHNFNVAGKILGCSREKALLGMLSKHLVSVLDLVENVDQGKNITYGMVNEKLGDTINYFILLEACLLEYIKIRNNNIN